MTSKHQFGGKKVRLGDVATYINGYAFKPSDYAEAGKPIIRIQDLTGNAYQTNRYSGELMDRYAVTKGDVLISWSASLGVFEWSGEDAWLNQHIFKVVFDKMPIERRYFIHHACYVIKRSSSLAHGATMRHLTKKVFENLPFFYPNLSDQTRIAKRLDLIQKQISNLNILLKKLDSLIKSRFVEMFGDPIENPKKWEIKQLEGVYEIIDGDRGKNYPKSSEFSETGFCLFLNAGNVTKQGFDFSSTQFITKEKDSLLRKGKLKRHDLVVTTRGTVGNIAYYDDYVPYENMRINSGMVILRAKKEIAKEYFVSFFRNPAIYNSLISGTAQPQMPIRSMKNTKMMLPPLFLQQEFAAFVHQVDKLKFETQQSIEKLQMLYDSLAQEYFAPEGD